MSAQPPTHEVTRLLLAWGAGARKVLLADGLLSTERGEDLVALDDALTALAA